ncbi:MAG: YdcF family protein [Clostridia bacterium]|nr:YdcF family protein [Clostridia bacterium]
MVYAFAALAILIFIAVIFGAREHKASKGTLTKAPDVLLVLGCRVRGERAEPTLQMRIDKAAEYLNENKGTLAIVCGGIVHKDQLRSEAEVMKEGLVSKGIEGERIILEDKSKTTVENFINAKEIMKSAGIEKNSSVAVLSSEFHLMRVKVIAEGCGLTVETLAAPSPKKELIKNYIREFFAFPITYSDIKGVK